MLSGVRLLLRLSNGFYLGLRDSTNEEERAQALAQITAFDNRSLENMVPLQPLIQFLSEITRQEGATSQFTVLFNELIAVSSSADDASPEKSKE